VEGYRERLAKNQAKLYLSCEMLFVSIRMHSFEITSEQFEEI